AGPARGDDEEHGQAQHAHHHGGGRRGPATVTRCPFGNKRTIIAERRGFHQPRKRRQRLSACRKPLAVQPWDGVVRYTMKASHCRHRGGNWGTRDCSPRTRGRSGPTSWLVSWAAAAWGKCFLE